MPPSLAGMHLSAIMPPLRGATSAVQTGRGDGVHSGHLAPSQGLDVPLRSHQPPQRQPGPMTNLARPDAVGHLVLPTQQLPLDGCDLTDCSHAASMGLPSQPTLSSSALPQLPQLRAQHAEHLLDHCPPSSQIPGRNHLSSSDLADGLLQSAPEYLSVRWADTQTQQQQQQQQQKQQQRQQQQGGRATQHQQRPSKERGTQPCRTSPPCSPPQTRFGPSTKASDQLPFQHASQTCRPLVDTPSRRPTFAHPVDRHPLQQGHLSCNQLSGQMLDPPQMQLPQPDSCRLPIRWADHAAEEHPILEPAHARLQTLPDTVRGTLNGSSGRLYDSVVGAAHPLLPNMVGSTLGGTGGRPYDSGVGAAHPLLQVSACPPAGSHDASCNSGSAFTGATFDHVPAGSSCDDKGVSRAAYCTMPSGMQLSQPATGTAHPAARRAHFEPLPAGDRGSNSHACTIDVNPCRRQSACDPSPAGTSSHPMVHLAPYDSEATSISLPAGSPALPPARVALRRCVTTPRRRTSSGGAVRFLNGCAT